MVRQSTGFDRLSRWAPVFLAGLALLLPFEAMSPLLRLGFVQITNVEAILYLAVFAWGLGFLGGRWRNWSICHVAVVAWALVVILSASFAPFERASALKFALRSLGGCAIFFAAADLSLTSEHVRKYAVAIVIGACVSALAGCFEAWWPAMVPLLAVFKVQPSAVGGYLRASGTFQYTTIAAMYWEASAPISLILALVYAVRGTSRWRIWFFLASLLLVVEATLLSISRAATVITPVILIICLGSARSLIRTKRAVLISCGTAILLPLLGHLLLGDSLFLRMVPDESTWYRVDYIGSPDHLELETERLITLPVKIRNSGTLVWSSRGLHPFALSYHWENPEKGGIVLWAGLRTYLPGDIKPGAEVQLSAWIRTPKAAGQYILNLDMMQEDVTWFSMQDSPTKRIPADVRLRNSDLGIFAPGSAEEEAVSIIHPQPAARLPRIELWRAAFRMWRDHPLLGVGPDNFRHFYGFYLKGGRFDDRIHSNSLYFESLACLGALGLLSLAGVATTLAIVLWRCWRNAARVEVKLLTLGLAGALASFYLHGTVDYFLEFTSTYGLYWLLAGLAAGLARSEAIK